MSDMPLGGNDGSSRSLEQASKWLNECRDTHPDCGPTDLSFCPSRLLELGSFGSDGPDTLQVRLVETKYLCTNIAYACLSHCWGGIKPACMTDKDTIHANLVRIPWSKIPRTFQDAMVLAWRLGLQYIWIDSLCIIQGDEEDWRKEAASMASVYSNSSITIAATSSTDCLQGLYRTEKSRDRVHKLKIRVFDQRPARVLAHPVSGGVDWMRHRQNHQQWYAGPRMPLLERAWFFQEWHLSPRLLHFVEGEIVWQCRCGSLSQWQAFEGHSFPCPAAKQVENASFIGGPLPPESKTQELWFDTVEAFSPLKLTYHEKDSLAALSGVAKTTGQLERGDTYVAGIWLESLHMELCWHALHPLGPGRSKECAAPSWSWASIDGAISYEAARSMPRDTSLDKRCYVRKVAVVHAGEDPTGPLESARMIVSGLAASCTLHYDSKDKSDDRSRYNISMKLVNTNLGTFFRPDYALDQPGENHLASGSPLQCLYLLGCSKFNFADCIESSYNPWVICLILTESKRQKGAYERVGLLEICSATTAIQMETQCDGSTFGIV